MGFLGARCWDVPAMNRRGAPERLSKDSRPTAASQKVDAGWLPTEFGKLSLFVVTRFYFSELLIELNIVFRLLPSPLTAAMIASSKFPRRSSHIQWQ